MSRPLIKSGKNCLNRRVDIIFLELSILNLQRGLNALKKVVRKKGNKDELRKEDFFKIFSFYSYSRDDSKLFLKLFRELGIIRVTTRKIYFNTQAESLKKFLK